MLGLPLKDKSHPKGIFTEQETYDMFAIMFMCAVSNAVPEHGFTLRTAAKPISDVVNQFLYKSINEASPNTSKVHFFLVYFPPS